MQSRSTRRNNCPPKVNSTVSGRSMDFAHDEENTRGNEIDVDDADGEGCRPDVVDDGVSSRSDDDDDDDHDADDEEDDDEER